MSSPKIGLPKRLVLALERVYDFIHRGIAHLTGQMRKPMIAEVYFAISHTKGITIKGRVLKLRKWRKPQIDDHALRNLWQMLMLWATPERPFSLVRLSCGDVVIEERADDEGYFEISLPPETAGARSVKIELPESKVSKPGFVEPRVSSAESRCLIVSDIDDTVLISHAAKTLRMIGTTLFGNALTRQIFAGTPQLYQSLKSGTTPDKSEDNPFAYVTSSPYNLHGLVDLIFKENRVPRGAYFMTDWGIDHEKWFKKSHSEHKLVAIREALEWFPDRPAILIGDSVSTTPISILS